jgi:hypothetical protein
MSKRAAHEEPEEVRQGKRARLFELLDALVKPRGRSTDTFPLAGGEYASLPELPRELYDLILTLNMTAPELAKYLNVLGRQFSPNWAKNFDSPVYYQRWKRGFVYWSKRLWRMLVRRDLESVYPANRGKNYGLADRLSAMLELPEVGGIDADPKFDDIGELTYALASWARRAELMTVFRVLGFANDVILLSGNLWQTDPGQPRWINRSFDFGVLPSEVRNNVSQTTGSAGRMHARSPDQFMSDRYHRWNVNYWLGRLMATAPFPPVLEDATLAKEGGSRRRLRTRVSLNHDPVAEWRAWVPPPGDGSGRLTLHLQETVFVDEVTNQDLFTLVVQIQIIYLGWDDLIYVVEKYPGLNLRWLDPEAMLRILPQFEEDESVREPDELISKRMRGFYRLLPYQDDGTTYTQTVLRDPASVLSQTLDIALEREPVEPKRLFDLATRLVSSQGRESLGKLARFVNERSEAPTTPDLVVLKGRDEM